MLVVRFYKFVYPAGEIGKNLVVKVDKYNLFTVPLGLNQLVYDTFDGSGTYPVNPFGQEPP